MSLQNQQVTAEVHGLCPSFPDLGVLLEQRPHTQMHPEERSRHHVVCQLFMDHSLQLSQQLEALIYFQSLYCFKIAQ